MNNETYKSLCTEYYELDKPVAPKDALTFYLQYIQKAEGPILEPMSGTGRFLIPALEQGFNIEGTDTSKHMLDVCRQKCDAKKLIYKLYQEPLETMNLDKQYKLIFIPTGSFCLIIGKDQVDKALKQIFDHLLIGATLIVEIETIFARSEYPGVTHSSFVKRKDGSIIVNSSVSKFNEQNNVETFLTKYEDWKQNKIINTEVEELNLQLYKPHEFDHLLKEIGFHSIKRLKPFTNEKAEDTAKLLVYVCQK